MACRTDKPKKTNVTMLVLQRQTHLPDYSPHRQPTLAISNESERFYFPTTGRFCPRLSVCSSSRYQVDFKFFQHKIKTRKEVFEGEGEHATGLFPLAREYCDRLDNPHPLRIFFIRAIYLEAYSEWKVGSIMSSMLLPFCNAKSTKRHPPKSCRVTKAATLVMAALLCSFYTPHVGAACPNLCGGNGVCKANSRCTCNPGYYVSAVFKLQLEQNSRGSNL